MGQQSIWGSAYRAVLMGQQSLWGSAYRAVVMGQYLWASSSYGAAVHMGQYLWGSDAHAVPPRPLPWLSGRAVAARGERKTVPAGGGAALWGGAVGRRCGAVLWGGAVGRRSVAVSHARGFPAALPVVPLRERAVPRSAAPRRAP